jgi:hypothetical protein
MGKIIKKTLKFMIIFIGILLLIPVMIAIALQIPAVQTAVVNRIMGEISAELRSSITIGRIEYEFFNKLAMDDLLFKDRNNDTLLYVRKLTAGIKRSSIKNRNFRFGRVELENPVFALVTDTAGQMNLNWYLEALKTDKPDTSKSGINVAVSRIDLTGASFSLINRSKIPEKEARKTVINFSDLQLSGINGVIEDFRLREDTVSMNIFDLAFYEKNGFDLKHLTSRFSHANGSIMLREANIRTENTLMELERLIITPDSVNGFSNFIEEVRLDMLMNKSSINTSDLRYFAPVPEGLNDEVSFEGRVTGTIAELRGRNIRIEYGTGTLLNCDFDFSGLPELENTFIYLGVNRFRTNANDLARLEVPGNTGFVVPEIIYNLGKISFEGSFTGFTTDFVTYGEFRTDEGGLRTDLSLRPEKDKNYRVKGQVIGKSINLAGLTGSKLLGELNMNVNINGYTTSMKEFSGEVRGVVDSIEINGYNYRNIQLSGHVSDKMWDGSVKSEDENIRFDLLGMLNFSDTLPEFNFTLNLAHADLYRLNIDRQDSTSFLSMILTTNFKGNSIDNIDGEIKLLSSSIEKHGTTMELYDFSVRSQIEKNIPVLRLRTDFLNADVKGKYNIKGLASMFKTISASLMPSLNGSLGSIPDDTGVNDFIFEINFRNTDKINEFFRTGILLAEGSTLKGSVRPGNLVTMEGKASSATYRNMVFADLSIEAHTSDSVLTADLRTSGFTLPGNTRLGHFSAELDTKPDTFIVKAVWNNQEKSVINKGIIGATGLIIPDNGMGKPFLRINIDSSEVYASDDLWRINGSSVTIDTSTIKFNNIHISSNNRFYHVNGSLSENPADTLHLEFRGIDISPLNSFNKKTPASDTAGIKIDLRGRLNGTVSLTGIYSNLLLESDLVINGFSILGSQYGDIFAYSEFNNSRKVVEIRASNDLRGVKMFEANGWYDPENKKISVGLTTDKLPVEALNPLLSSFASEITGHTSGRVRLSGTTEHMVLNGSVKAENVALKVNYLQTKYTLNDSIRFNNEGIRFNNVRFLDEGKRPANITGTVFHSNFRDYSADLTINMGSDDFMVLNTTVRDNPSFYGRVFAGGVVKIKTEPDLLSFDIVARTGRNTSFFIPLTDDLSVLDYSFITFIDSAARSQKDQARVKEEIRQLGLDVRIDLTVTSDATASIIFDEKVGDKITGRGTGLLNITLDPKGDFRITGDYTIEQGDYLFTLGNILNKRFMVENGGRIAFNGDLEAAEIELRAIYQKFNTSLFPVLHDPKYASARIPVEPRILLSGKLFNPTINFEINLPDADEETKTYLRNAISSDEELSRQFMYLLVMRSFWANETSNYTPTGTSTMAATTTEMLSNQLSNWISQISNDFNLGFTYNPGSGNREYNPDEVQIAFETQVLDDRVSLNGNFDYRGTSGSQTEQLTGDFEAEVKLTEKIRFKVFNRFNDHQLTGKGPYTQGIGILFREDFEKLADLFRKKDRKEAKKEEEITIADQ